MSSNDLPAAIAPDSRQRNINAITSITITPEQVALIKRTVANGATDDELKLFMYDCARRGAHPLDRLIHFTKRGGKYTPITGIDFMRTRAHESGACAGIGDPQFTGDAGSPEFSARVTVNRIVAGLIFEFSATARWSEYFPGEQGGHMWRKMPHTMLGKCAESLALRKAFPQELAGLYAREEMEQAGPDAERVTVSPREHRGVPEMVSAAAAKSSAVLERAVTEAPDSIAESVEAARTDAQGEPMLAEFMALCARVEKSSKRVLVKEAPAKSGDFWFVDKELIDRTLVGDEKPGSVFLQRAGEQQVSDNRLSRLFDCVQGLAERANGRSA
jgi:phage recombination protein Bet